MPDMDFAGRPVLVIGAAGALGAGLASAFAAAGAAVTGIDQALPAPQRQLAGVSYQAVNVLDDAALGGLSTRGRHRGRWSTRWAGSPDTRRCRSWIRPCSPASLN